MKSLKPKNLQKLHPIGALGNAPVREGEIRVERIENRLRPRVPFPHKHDFYHFLFLGAGSGWHEIDFQRFEVKKGQLFLMRPGQVHSWDLGKSTRGLVLEFTKGSLENSAKTVRLFDGLDRMPPLLGPAQAKEIWPLLRLMQEEFSSRAPATERCSRSYLWLCFCGCKGIGPRKVWLLLQRSWRDFVVWWKNIFRRNMP